MTREKAEIIIKEEKLCFHNWFEDHSIKPNEVSICKVDDKWCVFTTDERCCKVSMKIFSSEDEALEAFLIRVRAGNRRRRRRRNRM